MQQGPVVLKPYSNELVECCLLYAALYYLSFVREQPFIKNLIKDLAQCS